MIEEILKLIDAYWKFDENQHPMSSWHDKQDLLTAVEQLKNCNLQNVSNNEVSVCEKCQHYRKDNTPEICRRCFSNSHFQKAN